MKGQVLRLKIIKTRLSKLSIADLGAMIEFCNDMSVSKPQQSESWNEMKMTARDELEKRVNNLFFSIKP